MWLLMLEAGVALFLLIFIVWWTASGRKPDKAPKHIAKENTKPTAEKRKDESES